MTGTEVAVVQSQGALALRGDQTEWLPAQRAALDQIGIGEAPVGDQQVFLHVCQRTGLDPFARQIYMIGRKDGDTGKKKWTIQTGIDGFRVVSERHSQYAGVLDAEWCGDDGVWRDVWTAKTPPVAARFTVIRRDWEHPIRAVAHFEEYAQTKYAGGLTAMWAGKPAHMISKCAEALARRRAFPQDLAAVYSDDEMAHADNPPVVIIQSEREEPTEPDWNALIDEAEAARDRGRLGEIWKLARGLRPNDAALLDHIAQAGERVKSATAPPPAPAPEPAPAAPRPVSKARMNHLFGLLAKGNVKNKDARLRLAAHVLELDQELASFTDLTADQVDHLIARLEHLEANGQLGTAAPTADAPTADTRTEQPDTTEGDKS